MPRPGRLIASVFAASLVLGLLIVASSDPAEAVPLAESKPNPPRPTPTWKPIPFGDKRERQTAAYSKRHYGRWAWRLRSPRLIVQHYTTGTEWKSAWNHFAANTRNRGELPGTCTHFIIDTDGTVYHLVGLWKRCRHVIGLNWTSFGIEHVGRSDREVLRNRAQMRSSLRLTLWLMDRYDIRLRNVIGHNESLVSPFYVERYEDWRCQTHQDFTKASMDRYRARVKRLAERYAVVLGKPGKPADNGC